MSDTIVLAEEPAEVAGLGKALGRLWRREEQKDAAGTLSRALTMNFIGVTRADREPALREAVERLLLRHPCRAFLATLDQPTAAIAASVEARVRVHNKSRIMVLEQVNLRVPRNAAAKLPNLVRPLLVNDIPVHLFWDASLPTDLAEIHAFAQMADTVTVDSSLFASPAEDLARLAELAPLPVRDLSWFRLSPWRRALAEAFERFAWEPKPGTRVTITHGATTGARATSHLLQRWLVEKLAANVRLLPSGAKAAAPSAPRADATKSSASRTKATDASPKNPTSTPVNPPALEPAHVELEHGDVHVAVSHLCPEACLRVDVTLASHCLMPFFIPASRGSQGDLLAAAVDARR